MTSAPQHCPLCGDDGYVETWVQQYGPDGEWLGDQPVQSECPYLNGPGHAPFNATGILSGGPGS